MNRTRLHHVAPALLGIAALVMIACLPVRIARGDDISVTRVNKPVATIVKGIAVSQEFPAQGAEIGSLSLSLTTYGSVTRGTFQVTVDAQQDGKWQTLLAETIPTTALSATAADRYTLRLAHPLAVTLNQMLRVSVQSSEEDPASAITWWINPDYTPDGYVVRVNGKQQAGILCFAVTYQPRTGRLIQLLGPAWRRATIFLNTGWQVILLAGLGTFVVSLFVCAYVLLRMIEPTKPDPRSSGR